MTDVAGEGAALPPGTASLYLPLGGGITVPISVDAALVASVHTHKVSVEGGLGHMVVLTDRYASATVAGGEEVYVRLVDLAAAAERWSMLAASATAGQTAADPLIGWTENGFSVNVGDREPVVISLDEWTAPADAD